MKTIVIRPEVIAYHNAAFKQPKAPLNKAVVVCAILLPVVALTSWMAGRSSTQVAPATVLAVAPVVVPALRTTAALPPVAALPADGILELQTAIDQGRVSAEFTGNGRDQFTVELSNPSAVSAKVRVSFGQVFECGRNTVVAVRTAQTEVSPGKNATLRVLTAATRSTNRIGPATYRFSSKTLPKIDSLLVHAQDHPETPMASLQTAVLALTENLPLSSVCQFAPAGGDLPSRFDTTAFRVETRDILGALVILRQCGVRDRDVAMTVDPQLKIEAMIDPACRVAAMNYYGIASGDEWTFWKSQLLEGDPGTRHYALHGIARFYPEVALEMLPKWAREKRTTQVFRLAAVQALAETQRLEALPMLQQLVDDLGRNTELGRAAIESAQLLHAQLRKGSPAAPTVAFRSAPLASPF
jgi:hypothetical protein